jgi:hypothetical protein
MSGNPSFRYSRCIKSRAAWRAGAAHMALRSVCGGTIVTRLRGATGLPVRFIPETISVPVPHTEAAVGGHVFVLHPSPATGVGHEHKSGMTTNRGRNAPIGGTSPPAVARSPGLLSACSVVSPAVAHKAGAAACDQRGGTGRPPAARSGCGSMSAAPDLSADVAYRLRHLALYQARLRANSGRSAVGPDALGQDALWLSVRRHSHPGCGGTSPLR